MTHDEAMRNAVGDRVVAAGGIFYAIDGTDVPEGTRGVVRSIDCAGFLLKIEWEEIKGEHWTSFDAVERLAS